MEEEAELTFRLEVKAAHKSEISCCDVSPKGILGKCMGASFILLSICQSLVAEVSSCTACQRSSTPLYIVTYYIKWVTTSWTDGMIIYREPQ